MQMIHRDVLRQPGIFAEAFKNAQPFRHVVIEDFLDAALCRRILEEFPRFEDRYALNEMGQVGGKAVRMDVREMNGVYRDVDRYIQTREFLDFVSTVTGIPDLIYDPDYIGGGTHENRDGQGLDPHVDFNFHPGTRWHRRLNLIVYLNPEWEESWGGVLELQADPWQGDTRGPRIVPLFNRAVIFETTERSWHGFSTIHLPPQRQALSRKSFAIYLYTKERPVAETAVSHATVYVPDAMPQSLQAGTTLDEAQITDLRGRFERLRAQLHFLYDREKQFAAQIGTLEGALAEARGAMRLPVQGYVTQPLAPSGLWPDGWVGRELRASFAPQKKMRALVLELWAPAQLDGGQILDVDINGRRWQQHAAAGSRARATFDVRAASGETIELAITAQRTFVPARVGASGDERELAWKLLSAEVTG
jgi:2OG-Fe(II) oxygenase superfamily